MPDIHPGRFTANHGDGVVVFMIGMRINRFYRIGKWLPVTRAMGPMLAELSRDRESSFLGSEMMLRSLRTIVMLQYWRDFASLETYARASDREHWPAWTAFNRAVGNDGTVGIFHETYVVPAGGQDTIYTNMPAFGLGRVIGLIPASGSRATARDRLKSGADT